MFLDVSSGQKEEEPHGHPRRHSRHRSDRHGDKEDDDIPSSEDEDEELNYRESGAGILEFSPEKAGMDVTPANFNFEREKAEKRHSGALSSIAGG